MDNIGLFLVIGIVGIVACLGLIVVGIMWKPGPQTDQPKPPANLPATAAAASAPKPVASAPAALKPVPDAGSREVLRVLRNAATEELFVEVAGQRYTSMASIPYAGVREGLLTTLRDLEAFVGGAATVPPVVRMPTPAAEPGNISPMLTNVGTAKPSKTGTGPLLAPSMNPFKQMLVLRDLSKTQVPALKTIAEQIDEIVQEKLVGSPLSQRGVKVHTGLKGQALFRMDGQDYEAVDSLPDDEIRGLIRAAVAEWEKKQ